MACDHTGEGKAEWRAAMQKTRGMTAGVATRPKAKKATGKGKGKSKAKGRRDLEDEEDMCEMGEIKRPMPKPKAKSSSRR